MIIRKNVVIIPTHKIFLLCVFFRLFIFRKLLPIEWDTSGLFRYLRFSCVLTFKIDEKKIYKMKVSTRKVFQLF